MRRSTAWLAAAAILLGTACGGGGGEPASAPTSATPTVRPKPAKQATAAQLKAALPVRAELPKGWRATKPDDSGEDDLLQGCPELEVIEGDDSGLPVADAAFVNQARAEYFAVNLTSHRTVENAAAELEGLRAAYRACPSFTSKDAAGTITKYALSLAAFPPLGEDSYALTVEFLTDGVRGTMTFVAARFRNHGVLAMAARAGTAEAGGAEMDPALVERLVKAAVLKAQRTLRGV